VIELGSFFGTLSPVNENRFSLTMDSVQNSVSLSAFSALQTCVPSDTARCNNLRNTFLQQTTVPYIEGREEETFIAIDIYICIKGSCLREPTATSFPCITCGNSNVIGYFVLP
jgi:hypothetical protein